MKTTIKFKTWLTMGVLLSSFTHAMAQDARVLETDPIDINGYVDGPMATDSELENVKSELRKQKQTIVINKEKSKKYKELSRTTEKLADVTENLIDDRKEAKGEIDAYNKKIECLMNNDTSKDCEKFVKDSVSTKQAAVATPVVEEEVEVEGDQNMQVTLITGLTSLSGDQGNFNQLESEMAFALRLESVQKGKLSFGLGLNYMSLTTSDYGNNYFDSGFYPVYNGYYGQGRDISYTQYGVNVFTKYFLTKRSRFNPYLGVGFGVNRTTIKYQNNNSWNSNYYGYNFGNEEVSSTVMNGQLMAGADVKISQAFALSVEINYSKNLGSNFGNSNGVNASYAPDQRRLQDLNRDINDAHAFSFLAGASFKF